MSRVDAAVSQLTSTMVSSSSTMMASARPVRELARLDVGARPGDDGSPRATAVRPAVTPDGATAVDSPRRGRPVRKRRKSAEAGGWRSRYNADEFELGDAALASNDGSEESESERERGGDSGETEDAEKVEAEDWEEDDDAVVDVGGNDDGVDIDADLDVDAAGAVENVGGRRGGGRRPRIAKKRNPPNAWKRRCADGNCRLGASFGPEGKTAVYCSAHKDAGMVNVTHRRCEEPG